LKVCCPTVRQIWIRQTAVQSQQRRGFRSPSGFPHLFTNTTSQELEPEGNIPVYANVVKRAEISIKGYGNYN
jgi:hypothetical protein